MSLIFFNNLHRISGIICEALEREGLPHEVSANEALVLAHLAVYAPCPVSHVTGALGLRPSTMTSLLKRLGKHPLVKVEVDREDQRRRLLRLTPEGTLAAEGILQRLERLEQDVLAMTSVQEVDGYLAILDAMKRAMERE